MKNFSWSAAALCLLLFSALHLPSLATAEDTAPNLTSSSAAQFKNESAIALLNGLNSATDIYLWPSRRLPFELIEERTREFAEAIQSFNFDLQGRLELTEYGAFPLVSFNFYRHRGDHTEEFVRRTNLAANYRDYLATRDFTVDPCAFTVNTDRETWAAQAAVFIDLDRVSQQRLVECLLVAMDYVAGFPMPKDLGYRGVAPRSVRLPILSALIDCSISGETDTLNPEQSRDGITALPSISCALDRLRQ